jgi:DNA mismatch endonuclease, patch repair protein
MQSQQSRKNSRSDFSKSRSAQKRRRVEISERMRRIRKKDTKPELLVRRLVHRLGYRFRPHRHDLPGTPDIAFPSRSKVIFVNGCFWHQHECKLGSKQPRSNREYWLPKLSRNHDRDLAAQRALTIMGWKTLVIWECETRNESAMERRITMFLGDHL